MDIIWASTANKNSYTSQLFFIVRMQGHDNDPKAMQGLQKK